MWLAPTFTGPGGMWARPHCEWRPAAQYWAWDSLAKGSGPHKPIVTCQLPLRLNLWDSLLRYVGQAGVPGVRVPLVMQQYLGREGFYQINAVWDLALWARVQHRKDGALVEAICEGGSTQKYMWRPSSPRSTPLYVSGASWVAALLPETKWVSLCAGHLRGLWGF